MIQFTIRPVYIIDLPIPNEVSILKPEQVLLRFKKQHTVDIGSLCYLQREHIDQSSLRRVNVGRKVDLLSLCQSRVEQVRILISFISNYVVNSGLAESTAYTYFQVFVSFINWADENNHSDFLNNRAATRYAMEEYSRHIRNRVITNEIKVNYGANLLRRTFSILSEFLAIEDLSKGINILHLKAQDNVTVPPSEEIQGRYLLLCESVFEGLTSHVLNNIKYPSAIQMPEYLGFKQNQMWVFPVKKWFISAAEKKQIVGAYNYPEGRTIPLTEKLILEGGVLNQKSYKETIYNGNKHLKLANNDQFHWHRKTMAMMAHNVFIAMFISRTGMNWQQVKDLHWAVTNEEDKVSSIRQRFREIKHRAGEKAVNFQLPLSFMPSFKKFLELRKYLLRDNPEFNMLFFSFGLNFSNNPSPLRSNLQAINKCLLRIDNGLTPIYSRAWRAAMSDWLITRTDISTAAVVLQNTENTVKRNYAAGSIENHLSEMSDFLSRVIVEKSSDSTKVSTIAVGECISYGLPLEIDALTTLVKPNCSNPEIGCLFCDKYKVHADETDVRKLLSCRYCLVRTSHLANYHIQSEPLVDRIELIIEEIKKRNPSLISRVTSEIEAGDLDPYWANKYDMLLRMRLVNDIE